MESFNEIQAWNLLNQRFKNIERKGYKSLRMQSRYHKQARSAAAGTLQFFNVARNYFQNNNEKANVLGTHYGIYYGLLVSLYENNAVWTATSDFLKVIQDTEIEVKCANKEYLSRTSVAPYVRNVMSGVWEDGNAAIHITAEGKYDAPRVSIPYRPNEFIEVIVHCGTAPAYAMKIAVFLFGIEAHRAEAG